MPPPGGSALRAVFLMRMQRKRLANMTRGAFLAEVEGRCPSYSAQRAIQDGHVELLGLFSSPEHCWVIRVERRYETSYFLVREERSPVRQINVRWLDAGPAWRAWIGDLVEGSPINLGDHPDQYSAFRQQARHGGHRAARNH